MSDTTRREKRHPKERQIHPAVVADISHLLAHWRVRAEVEEHLMREELKIDFEEILAAAPAWISSQAEQIADQGLHGRLLILGHVCRFADDTARARAVLALRTQLSSPGEELMSNLLRRRIYSLFDEVSPQKPLSATLAYDRDDLESYLAALSVRPRAWSLGLMQRDRFAEDLGSFDSLVRTAIRDSWLCGLTPFEDYDVSTAPTSYLAARDHVSRAPELPVKPWWVEAVIEER